MLHPFVMTGTIKLHSFDSHIPPYSGAQSVLNDWILQRHGLEDDRQLQMLRRFMVSEKQIARRSFECPDVEAAGTILKGDIQTKARFYTDRATKSFEAFYNRRSFPDHLVHVTCTGYTSPSAPQLYFAKGGTAPAITHAYHMGCYAALPAIRLAQSLSMSEQVVDVVHNEVCSLHLDLQTHTPEQMVVQSLFADGHIKYTLSRRTDEKAFGVRIVKEKLIPNSAGDMTWIPSSSGMRMTLSKEVPEKIRDHVPQFVRELAADANVDLAQLLRRALFAVHPGGPRIIDAIVQKLELSEEQVIHSRQVLRNRGNMSSATLPHVWQQALSSDHRDLVVSLAFGPGLTIFGAIFEVHA